METAAILHDLDKALPADDPLRSLGHGHAGASWLREHGYAELAPVVESHPVGRLTDQPYEDWIASTTVEQRIVAYADKRAQQRIVTLDQRFDRWVRRHPDMTGQLAIARERAGSSRQRCVPWRAWHRAPWPGARGRPRRSAPLRSGAQDREDDSAGVHLGR